MRAGNSPGKAPVRRVEHAHRIRQPHGPSDVARLPARQGPRGTRARGRAGPEAGSVLAIVLIALVAVVLRPWEGILGSSGGAGSTGAVAAATARPAPVAASSTAPGTIGPHGDGVAGPQPTAAATPPSSAAPTSEPSAGLDEPLPEPLLAGYQWPTSHARITNGYGAGLDSSFRLDGEEFHDGIDIASFCGARITAAHDGLVLGAGRHNEALLGWVGDLTAFRAKLDAEDAWGSQAITVVIDDGNGYRSIYAHLGVAVAKRGQQVKAGDLIGWEGASGNATGCHLHYALFDPEADGRLTLDPKIAKKTKLPPLEVARIDPLLVLPPPETADIAWGWGAKPR